MSLLALWRVQDNPDGDMLMYTFREPVQGDVRVWVCDANGFVWDPVFSQSKIGGLVYGVAVESESEWLYPIRIQIKGA